MPKRYQCEFCHKSFQDTPVARRRHLKGAGHQRNRRLHYESFSNEKAGGVRHERAEILYSELSGEEILRQWLSSHPELVQRCEEMGKKRTRKEEVAVRDGSTKQAPVSSTTGPSLTQAGGKDMLPAYLEPYRAALPPSLLPQSAGSNYPHALLPDELTGWG
ncbi:Zinc finger CCCH domain-containing protein 3 [Geodia barretti]|uniref:Zinc finger CCCH domain-containing protein 3 n=1 Tax=Geodia barretti TaxID=519541 RepID=A0AA35WEF8_GEOBA|nr:Zinc finger CCCH domain-containing protein 3 [Geodia barretti]